MVSDHSPHRGHEPGPHRAAAMKHWQETRDIARRLDGAPPGAAFAVATVIAIEGSAYRHPGAKLLIEDAGTLRGGVSGGCLEADVREVGLDALREGRVCTRRYETGTDAETVWGLGLGCEGRVDLVIQPVTPERRAVWSAAATALEGDTPFLLATPVDGTNAGHCLMVAASGAMTGSTGDPALDAVVRTGAASRIAVGISGLEVVAGTSVFCDVLLPPPWLTVFGAGDDAQPLVRFAAALGFRTAVVDHRPAYVTRARFPEAHRLVARPAEDGVAELPLGPEGAAVVMTHSLTHDIAWVTALRRSPLMYLGLLGPQGRVARILAEADTAAGGHIYGPVGLDLGAAGPEQIALSILAELLAVRANRGAGSLRDRGAAIHA